jgi:hypothetical protein
MNAISFLSEAPIRSGPTRLGPRCISSRMLCLPLTDVNEQVKRIRLRLTSPESRLASTSRSKSVSVFARGDKCLHHFGVNEVAVKLVEFVKPEVVTS